MNSIICYTVSNGNKYCMNVSMQWKLRIEQSSWIHFHHSSNSAGWIWDIFYVFAGWQRCKPAEEWPHWEKNKKSIAAECAIKPFDLFVWAGQRWGPAFSPLRWTFTVCFSLLSLPRCLTLLPGLCITDYLCINSLLYRQLLLTLALLLAAAVLFNTFFFLSSSTRLV